jgi:vitamin B12 transporter
VRGTASAFYGASSLAGAIQLFSPRGGPGPVRGRLGVEAGNASLLRGVGRLSGQTGAHAWAFGGAWADEAGRVGEDRFEQLDLWGTGDLKLGSKTDVALSLRYASGEQDDYPDSSGGPVYGSGDLRSSQHEDVSASVRLRTTSKSRLHDVSFGFVHRSLDRESPAVQPVIPASTTGTGFTRARLGWEVPVVTSGRSHVDVGLTAEGEWGESVSLLHLPPHMGGDLPGDFEVSRQNAGAFAGWRHERGRLELEASVRGDVSTDASAQLNPRAGLVWRTQNGRTRVFGSLGRASKVPSFYALGSPRALGGNPDLRPESAMGGECGVEFSPWKGTSPRLTIGVSAFGQWYEDLIDFDFDVMGLVNRSQVRTSGLETRLTWIPRGRVKVDGELTWLRAEDRDGATLLQEPELFGGMRVTWTPTQRSSVRAFARAVSKYEDRQIPAPDVTRVKGKVVTGLAGSWRLHDGFTVQGRIDNLLDAEYETLIGFPGPRRSAWVGIGWERP